ncbi:translocation protein SEC62-like [Ornithodoros turicata]|uniref:Translocation protein SEC62 n=1 Tax=Ornithodoros turicata TaxID=34597 RepID=A0A2R5LKC8_9ACAR
MAQVERRKNRKKREKDEDLQEDKPSKVEYEVARYLRDKLPVKKTSLLEHKVEYFNAARSVDCLLDSPWATGKGKKEKLFTTRESVVEFMNILLRHKFFHRAKKIIITKTKKKKDESEGSTPKVIKEKKSVSASGGEDSKEAEEKKDVEEKKKRLKLDMHLDQIFVDANEPYVWIYDPVPLKAWIIGASLVVGAVAISMFPLWPRTVRDYVYYLSLATAFVLGTIFALALLRHVVFFIVWACTMGKHHFWFLPNLTEDVGILESFWPLYQYEYRGAETDAKVKQKNSSEETAEEKPSGEGEENGQGDNGFEVLDHPEKDKEC